ncbi:MAG: hypothetical protein H6658_02050 [Ardenticatenaceae bacterium]|nr:hypothetical protein [Ardenticatenaceae bacterium]
MTALPHSLEQLVDVLNASNRRAAPGSGGSSGGSGGGVGIPQDPPNNAWKQGFAEAYDISLGGTGYVDFDFSAIIPEGAKVGFFRHTILDGNELDHLEYKIRPHNASQYLSLQTPNGVHYWDDFITLPLTENRIVQVSIDEPTGSDYVEFSIEVVGWGMGSGSGERLIEWAEGGDYEMTAITYHGTYTNVVSSATVRWPDGSLGTFTATNINATYEAIDAYKISHTNSGLTVTQTAVTRNADGNITVKPALSVPAGSGVGNSESLIEWAEGGDYEMTAITYHGTYTSVVSSATVKWPDGSAGTFTAISINATYEAIDAYTISHTNSGLTVTQTAVTRNADGNITTKPILTVA